MLNLAIPLPDVPGKQDIEIEMNLNGRRRKLHYRVEVFDWSNCLVGAKDRVDCIRDVVESYHEDWEIYHIGQPTENFVPLTFIKRSDWESHLRWLWSKHEGL